MKTLTLSNAGSWKLPFLAILTIIAGAVSFEYDRRLPPPVWEGRDLLPGLNLDSISKIKIEAPGQEVQLARQGNNFFVENLDMVPASAEKVNEILLRIGGAQISRSLGGKESWEKYAVAEGKAEYTISINGADGKEFTRLWFGKSQSGVNGLPVRVKGKDEVFLTSSYVWFDRDASSYQSTEAFKLNAAKVKLFEAQEAGKKLAEGKYDRNEFLAALSPLKVKKHFRSGKAHADLEGVNWNYQFRVEDENGLGHNIELGKKEERWFARAQAYTVAANEGPVLDISHLTLKAQADRFNNEKLPWVWEVSSESIEKLKKGLKL